MITSPTPWKILSRKTPFDTKFLKVHEETVELPDGTIIDDYTLVEKPSVVMVVAVDCEDRLVVLHEYKHGARKYLYTLPAGHIKKGESPEDAARRELLEETGYEAKDVRLVGTLYDYPSKDLHTVSVVLATDIEQKQDASLENTESLSFQLISIPQVLTDITSGVWQSSSAIAALTVSGVLHH